MHAGSAKWRPRSLQDAETRAKGGPSPAKRPRVDPAAGTNENNHNYETSQTRKPDPDTHCTPPPLLSSGSVPLKGSPLPSKGLEPEERPDTTPDASGLPHGTPDLESPQADLQTKDPTMEDPAGADHPMDGSFVGSPARDNSASHDSPMVDPLNAQASSSSLSASSDTSPSTSAQGDQEVSNAGVAQAQQVQGQLVVPDKQAAALPGATIGLQKLPDMTPLYEIEQAKGARRRTNPASTDHRPQADLLPLMYDPDTLAAGRHLPFLHRLKKPHVSDYAAPDDGALKVIRKLPGDAGGESSVEVYSPVASEDTGQSHEEQTQSTSEHAAPPVDTGADAKCWSGTSAEEDTDDITSDDGNAPPVEGQDGPEQDQEGDVHVEEWPEVPVAPFDFKELRQFLEVTRNRGGRESPAPSDNEDPEQGGGPEAPKMPLREAVAPACDGSRLSVLQVRPLHLSSMTPCLWSSPTVVNNLQLCM